VLIRSLAFAVRSLVRQPGRTLVGIVGIAAVGALLFDMLLLSRGLLVSFRDLLDQAGYDVRAMAVDVAPLGGPRVPAAGAAAAAIAGLPEVEEAAPMRVSDAELVGVPDAASSVGFGLIGFDAHVRRSWSLVSGDDRLAAAGAPTLLLNRRLAETARAKPGDALRVRVSCGPDRAPLPPTTMRVAAIVDFPFDSAGERTAFAARDVMTRACGDDTDDADMILVASKPGYGPDAAVAAIRRLRPDLHAATNEQIVSRMQETGFSYFRQISTVLSTITLLFGFLLITVLMTVSVNQRLGEIAAIRALGFSRGRVAADVLWQSALLVGVGGVIAIPAGFALSLWLDRILKAMPGVPASLHFFVFEPRALVVHAALLSVTAVLAAAYPMQLVASLPIATTLRNEVGS
jgi:ABC-type lipoprotein release transport system permease subunit